MGSSSTTTTTIIITLTTSTIPTTSTSTSTSTTLLYANFFPKVHASIQKKITRGVMKKKERKKKTRIRVCLSTFSYPLMHTFSSL